MKLNYMFFVKFSIGLIAPWPLYFEQFSLTPNLVQFNLNSFSLGSDNSLIPLIAYSLLLIFVFLGVNKHLLKFLFCSIVLSPLVLIIFNGIPFARVCALFFPIVLIFLFGNLIRSEIFKIDSFIAGYITGFILLYTFNILSFISGTVNTGVLDFAFARQVFGFEIYAFYVSYSAVAALNTGFYLLALLSFKRIKKSTKIYFFVLVLLSLSIVILSERRAALVDLYFLFLLIFAAQFKNLLQFKSSYRSILFLIVSFLFLIPPTLNLFSSLFLVFNVRDQAYFEVIALIDKASFGQLLFGFRSGFGGFSNLFLELVVRSGLVGLFAYLSFFAFSVSYFWASIKLITNNRLSFADFVPLLFCLFSLLSGNIINLNLSLPYYSFNLALITLIYSRLLSWNLQFTSASTNVTLIPMLKKSRKYSLQINNGDLQ